MQSREIFFLNLSLLKVTARFIWLPVTTTPRKGHRVRNEFHQRDWTSFEYNYIMLAMNIPAWFTMKDLNSHDPTHLQSFILPES